MALSEAKRKANDKYIKANYQQIKLSVPNIEGDTLRDYCEKRDIKIAGFIREAIKKEMNYDEMSYTIKVVHRDKTTEYIGNYTDLEEAKKAEEEISQNAEEGTDIFLIKA